MQSALNNEMRLNADQVQTSITNSESGNYPLARQIDTRIDQSDPTSNFFNTNHYAEGMDQITPMKAGPATESYTSLKHFKVRSNRH